MTANGREGIVGGEALRVHDTTLFEIGENVDDGPPAYDGIRATSATITGCTVEAADRDGISLTSGGSITASSVMGCRRNGILTGAVEEPQGPAVAEALQGQGTSISECTVSENSHWGISGAWRTKVTDCTITRNGTRIAKDNYKGGGAWLTRRLR